MFLLIMLLPMYFLDCLLKEFHQDLVCCSFYASLNYIG
jgi:hypothetical protein